MTFKFNSLNFNFIYLYLFIPDVSLSVKIHKKNALTNHHLTRNYKPVTDGLIFNANCIYMRIKRPWIVSCLCCYCLDECYIIPWYVLLLADVRFIAR